MLQNYQGHPAEVECLLCDELTMDGVQIGAFRICAMCEERLMQTAPDHSDYDEFVTRLRPIGMSALRAIATHSALGADRQS